MFSPYSQHDFYYGQSTVCTIRIVLFGSICIPLLPVEYIPQIAPIQVEVTATYTGADPETIETTVTTPIERKINGTGLTLRLYR